MIDITDELTYEGPIIADPGMFGRVVGTLFGVFGCVNFVGKDLPILAQGYCVHLGAWVNLGSYGLCPILCGEQQLGLEGDLFIWCALCQVEAFFRIAGSLLVVSCRWCWKGVDLLCYLGDLLEWQEERLWEGLWLQELVECIPGEMAGLVASWPVLSGMICLIVRVIWLCCLGWADVVFGFIYTW